MRDNDLKPFTELLDATCGLLSRGAYSPSAINTALWFRALQPYTLDHVRVGFDAHVRDPQRGRFVPTPADIIAQIEGVAATDGRPGAEEAWAIALRSRDEADTVVWTREIAQAIGIARPILDLGDEVGARMAFREAYGRLVDEARKARAPASWEVSLGFDPKRRDEAVRAAVAEGRLPAEELPALEGPAVPLLTLAESGQIPEHIRTDLRRLTESLRNGLERTSLDAKARAETAALRAAAAQRVEEYAKAHGIALTFEPTQCPDASVAPEQEAPHA
jgi:hypothetical protein